MRSPTARTVVVEPHGASQAHARCKDLLPVCPQGCYLGCTMSEAYIKGE